jgi:hypothetical protein
MDENRRCIGGAGQSRQSCVVREPRCTADAPHAAAAFSARGARAVSGLQRRVSMPASPRVSQRRPRERHGDRAGALDITAAHDCGKLPHPDVGATDCRAASCQACRS